MTIHRLGDRVPRIDAEAYVAPGAQLIGLIELHARASVWFNAVLRGDNEPIRIGARTNIQDGAMLHTDPGFPLDLGEDVTIGHHAIVHGCTVGAATLIGMGAAVLNGARIGAGCIVGANALVTENKEFPDNSLIVGAPAKAVRTLDGAAAEKVRASALHYVANWRRFAAGLKRIG